MPDKPRRHALSSPESSEEAAGHASNVAKGTAVSQRAHTHKNRGNDRYIIHQGVENKYSPYHQRSAICSGLE
eukprot:scaffold546462_cov28-Prasinocladus_malaysianus.AAC.1